MQNRGAIWVFTILLTLASLYQLSFSWVTKGLENKAEKYAEKKWKEAVNSGEDYILTGRDTIYVFGEDGQPSKRAEQTAKNFFEQTYISEHADEPIYPVFGLTYRQCNDQKLGTGLDLQGGMSVTLEVSIPDLVLNKAGNSLKPAFREPFNAALKAYSEGKSDDFISLFEEAYNNSEYEDEKMTFFNIGDKDNFPLDATNEEMIATLRKLAKDAIDNTEKIIETRINRFGVSQPSIQKQPISGRLHIELPGAKDKERVRKLLQSRAELGFWLGYPTPLNDQFLLLNEELKKQKDGGNVENDLVEELEVKEKTDTLQVNDSTEVVVDSLEIEDELGLEEEADSTKVDEAPNLLEGPLFELLNIEGAMSGPYIGYAKAKDTAKINRMLNSDLAKSILPSNVMFRWSSSDQDGRGYMLYALEVPADGKPLLTGDDISTAKQDYNQEAKKVTVSVTMTPYGAERWKEITTNNVGRMTAIVLDDQVYSAPVINGPIPNGNTEISGDFTIPEAQDLATVLEAGSFDTPAVIVDEAVVGPTLGEENIRAGMWSFIAALILVLAYMIFYYGTAGVVASIALFANIFFLLGALASMGATLTLPGIAGLVLTLGMSVDANVLIFERIREELRAGKGMKLAIAEGYKNAYSAILDANITSLLTAIVLLYFGTGPIEGFAMTLIVGIFTSLYSSIILTRLIFSYLLDKNKEISFSRPATATLFIDRNYDFVGRRKKFYLVSIVAVLISLVSLLTIGLDKGVEFTGGRVYRIEFNGDAPSKDAIANAVKEVSVEDGKKIKPEVKTVNNEFTLDLTTKYLYTDISKDATQKVDSVITLALENAGYQPKEKAGAGVKNTFLIIEQRSVNPQISNELILGSFFAVLFSLIVIFVYIAARFRNVTFGMGALIAMFHDVIIVLGLFSLLYNIMPFSMQIDQAFIAAILTVVGYSINDTVVVFDRIREYLVLHKRHEEKEVVNKALNSTLSRTLNTSMTTFVVLLVIFLFGGESIRGFSFALMIGVVVGTYSSLFIASPSVIDLSKDGIMNKKDDKK